MTARKKATKRRLAISIDPAMYAWLEDRVGPGKPYGSMTHAIETSVQAMIARAK